MSTLRKLDCARSVRSASATVGPSAESPAGDRKSATITVSCAPKAPLPRSEAAGPMPNARLTMNPTTRTANAPTARPPPIQVRRQETWGLALRARVARVPWAGTPPPGVCCGVVANARYAVRWTKAVIPMTGSPQHHAERAGEHPVRETDDFGSRPGRHSHRGGRARPQAERLADRKPAFRAGPPAPPPRSHWW